MKTRLVEGRYTIDLEQSSILVPRGTILQAAVEGTKVKPYRVTLEFDASGVTNVQCTCPYEYSGWRKHIVATLLTYNRQPNKWYLCTLGFLRPLYAQTDLKPPNGSPSFSVKYTNNNVRWKTLKTPRT